MAVIACFESSLKSKNSNLGHLVPGSWVNWDLDLEKFILCDLHNIGIVK